MTMIKWGESKRYQVNEYFLKVSLCSVQWFMFVLTIQKNKHTNMRKTLSPFHLWWVAVISHLPSERRQIHQTSSQHTLSSLCKISVHKCSSGRCSQMILKQIKELVPCTSFLVVYLLGETSPARLLTLSKPSRKTTAFVQRHLCGFP